MSGLQRKRERKMKTQRINKTMDREDLLLPSAEIYIARLNALIDELRAADLHLSAWNGILSSENARPLVDSRNCGTIGNYAPLPDAADDAHFPWFLYWEIFWTMTHAPLPSHAWILDAGGSCSLFWAYISSLGSYNVFSCELNQELVEQGNKIADRKGWNSFCGKGDVTLLEDFASGSFDAVFSICVFEHLAFQQRRRALIAIARVLKRGGILALTFDYKNPAPAIYSPEDDPEEHLISTPEQIRRNLIDEDLFEILFNKRFHDNGKRYLGHPKVNYAPYTFGAFFLRRR